MTTITLSNIPDMTAAVGAPRVAAIEYPFGRTVGQPGDIAGQLAVLGATLKALEEMRVPGEIKHLPFEWPETPRQARTHPPEAPPIVKYLQRHPWDLRRLFTRDVPAQP